MVIVTPVIMASNTFKTGTKWIPSLYSTCKVGIRTLTENFAWIQIMKDAMIMESLQVMEGHLIETDTNMMSVNS